MLPEETALVGNLVREVLSDDPAVRLVRERIFEAMARYSREVSDWHCVRNSQGAKIAGPLPLDPTHPFIETMELLDCEKRRTRWPLEVPEADRMAVFVALLAAWVDKSDGRSGSHLLTLFPDEDTHFMRAVMERDHFAEQAQAISDARVLSMATQVDRLIPTLFAAARPKGAPAAHTIRARWGGLPGIRDLLFRCSGDGYELADTVERLEKVCAKRPKSVQPDSFYVASTALSGRELCEPIDEMQWPRNERQARVAAIEATLSLRAAIDDAIRAVTSDGISMDIPADAPDRRWTIRTIGALRKLRGAILTGHDADVFPSALPMIRSGVSEALRKHAQAVAERMEELKTVLIAGPLSVVPAGLSPAEIATLLMDLKKALARLDEKDQQSGFDDFGEALSKPGGWTRKELVEEAKADDARFSPTTFDRVRRAAGIKPSLRGGTGQQRRFSVFELRRLIAAVKNGPFRDKTSIVAAWSRLMPSVPPTNIQ